MASTIEISKGIGWQACFVAVAGVAEVLAGEPIRGLLQARPPVAHVAEQPPAPPPESLLEGDESLKLAVMVGALLLGHRSSHLRATC